MANVKKVSISLSDENVEMMNEAMSGGFYNSTSEIVREALRDWGIKNARLEALRHEIRKGIDDLEAGRFVVYDSPGQLFDDIMKD